LPPSEEKKLNDFDANLAKLKAKEAYWHNALKEAQKQQQGVVKVC
jgi:hypothetical protein